MQQTRGKSFNFDVPEWLDNMIVASQLPVLDIGNKVGRTDYIDFISVEDVNAPIMYGIDIYKRPFITLRVIDRETGTTSVHTIFQRYTNLKEPWCCGTRYKRIIDTCVWKKDRDFLSRLFKHQPCGNNLFYGEEGNKTTADAKPIIELC